MSMSIRKRYIKSSKEAKQNKGQTIDCEKQQEIDYKVYRNSRLIKKDYSNNTDNVSEKNQKHFNYFNLKINKIMPKPTNNNNFLFSQSNKINVHKVNFTEMEYIYEKPEIIVNKSQNYYNQSSNYRNSSSEFRIKQKKQQNLEDMKNILKIIINHEFQKLKPNLLKILINRQDIDIILSDIYKNIQNLLNEYNTNNINSSNNDFIYIDIVTNKYIINEIFERCKSEILNEYKAINNIYQNYFALDNKLKNTYTYKLNRLKLLTNFRKHCNRCNDVACHSCKYPLYIIPNSNYIICKHDKEIYNKNNIICFCGFDNEVYLSSFLPEGYRNNMLPLANRNSLEDEMITCSKCKHTIFFNIRENTIKCIKCNNVKFDENNDVFYNESFYGKLKDEINFALLLKKKSNNNIKCHCNGTYYKGEFLGKSILICSKCKKSIYEKGNENSISNKRFKYKRHIINDKKEEVKNINNNRNFLYESKMSLKMPKNSSSSSLNRKVSNNKNKFESKNLDILNLIAVKPVPEEKTLYYRRKYQNISTQNNENQTKKEFQNSKIASNNKSYVNRRSYYIRNKNNPVNIIKNVENPLSHDEKDIKDCLWESKTNEKKIFSFFSQKNNKNNSENKTINIEINRTENKKKYDTKLLYKASEIKREDSFDEINKQILNKMLTNSLTERNFKSLLKNIDPNLIKELSGNNVLNNIKELENSEKILNSEINKDEEIIYDVKTLTCNSTLHNRQKHLINKYTFIHNSKSTNNNINNIAFRKTVSDNNIKFENSEKNFTIPSNLNMNDYNIICLIGSRCFSNIYKVQNNKTKKKYAVKKIIIEGEIKLSKRKNELLLMQQLSCGYFFDNINIIPVIQYYIKKLDLTAYAMYELMPLAETDWDKKIFRDKEIYTEEKLIKIMKQLVKALSYMQKDNICHRDIKPSNILIMNDNFYLGDFEESTRVDTTDKKNLIMEIKGTEAFLSPLLFEALVKNQKKVLHNVYKSDVFSLGLCFVCALTKNIKLLDFIKLNKESWKIKKIIMKNYDKRCTVSDKFIDLILKMLAFEENERYDFIELDEIVNNW